MEETAVTILVSVYNIENYLERFFGCLGKQTYKDYKVLILDDGSTDNSLSICRAHAEKDSRITVVANEHVGIVPIRNKSIAMLDTEFAACLDGDDFFEPDYLKHLMDAQKKYDADFVISNVIYVTHEGDETSRFSPRKEAFFTKEQLPDILPELLEEERLNYVYTKLYRTKYLKDVRIEPDVKYGGDTLINMQYALRINNLAVIEAYDYYYIQHPTQSITSKQGTDFFWRLYRINKYLYDLTEQNGLLNDKMKRVIDERILLSGKIALRHIGGMSVSMTTKLEAAHKTIHSDEYLLSYNRLKENGQLDSLRYKVIHPSEEDAFIHEVCTKNRIIKKHRILTHTPKFISTAYHKVKTHLRNTTTK